MKNNSLLRHITTALGFISSLWFIGNYFIFELLRPKMIRFATISAFEEGLMNYVGIGWLLMTIFLIISFYRIAIFLKNQTLISRFYIFLLTATVISILFIFGDLALINDIGKQYEHGLSQPEWLVLYPFTAFQFITGLVLTYTNYFLLREKGKKKFVVKDSNIFSLVNFVGALCGFFGLSLVSLNFLFPRPLWMIKYHVIATSIFSLVPYILIISYWFFIKFQEKSRQLYDEKQIQDIGLSSLITLVLSIAIMSLVFLLNFNSLGGVVSVIWLPLYAFLVLFLFSAANLYRSRDNVT